MVDEARSWLGVPFCAHGRTRDGVDCLGLIVVVANDVLSDAIAFDDYSMQASTPDAFRIFLSLFDRIADTDAGPGDLVQMNFRGRSTHIGILTDTTIIHAAQKTGRVVEHSIAAAKRSTLRPVAYYRIRGVAPWRS